MQISRWLLPCFNNESKNYPIGNFQNKRRFQSSIYEHPLL